MLDKGLLDALLSTPSAGLAKSALENMFDSLAPGGLYVLVTHGSPDTRGSFLKSGTRAQWSSVRVLSLPSEVHSRVGRCESQGGGGGAGDSSRGSEAQVGTLLAASATDRSVQEIEGNGEGEAARLSLHTGAAGSVGMTAALSASEGGKAGRRGEGAGRRRPLVHVFVC